MAALLNIDFLRRHEAPASIFPVFDRALRPSVRPRLSAMWQLGKDGRLTLRWVADDPVLRIAATG